MTCATGMPTSGLCGDSYHDVILHSFIRPHIHALLLGDGDGVCALFLGRPRDEAALFPWRRRVLQHVLDAEPVPLRKVSSGIKAHVTAARENRMKWALVPKLMSLLRARIGRNRH
jgi:hypothetical protein